MQTVFNFLAHTPIYVYFIFAYLITIGIRAIRGRVVSFSRSAIILCVFFYFFITSIAKLDLNNQYYFLILFVFIASVTLSWILTGKKKILVDKKKLLISLPGSCMTMILVLIIFCSKYYLGYRFSRDASFILSNEAKWLTILSSGFSFGFIVGRFLNYIYRFKVDQHTSLSKQSDR